MNGFFRKFIEIIIYGNVWISLGATALTLNTFLLMKWEININLLLLVFFATLLSYTFQRVVRHNDQNSVKSSRHQWVYSHKRVLFTLMLVYTVISGVLFFTLFSFIELIYFTPLILIALFYAVKIAKKSLRDISFIKIILISLSWAAVSVLIPAYFKHAFFTDTLRLEWLFLINFFYIFALVIPFDIRDLISDESNKKTIPQLMGVKGAKYLATLLVLLCAVLSFLYIENAPALYPVFGLSIVLILFTTEKNKEMFFAFGIDGLILLFPISTYIINAFI